MNDDLLKQLAWQIVQQEHVDRFRRGAYPWAQIEDCTCPTIWMSILPPPPCPYHGRAYSTQITC